MPWLVWSNIKQLFSSFTMTGWANYRCTETAYSVQFWQFSGNRGINYWTCLNSWLPACKQMSAKSFAGSSLSFNLLTNCSEWRQRLPKSFWSLSSIGKATGCRINLQMTKAIKVFFWLKYSAWKYCQPWHVETDFMSCQSPDKALDCGHIVRVLLAAVFDNSECDLQGVALTWFTRTHKSNSKEQDIQCDLLNNLIYTYHHISNMKEEVPWTSQIGHVWIEKLLMEFTRRLWDGEPVCSRTPEPRTNKSLLFPWCPAQRTVQQDLFCNCVQYNRAGILLTCVVVPLSWQSWSSISECAAQL